MVNNTDCAVQRNHEAHDEERERNDANGFPPAQPNGDDACSELPGRGVESIGDPVGDEGSYTPFTGVTGDGVEVFVSPV
jgi:hypothetical protein